jgi:hypothetical protein
MTASRGVSVSRLLPAAWCSSSTKARNERYSAGDSADAGSDESRSSSRASALAIGSARTNEGKGGGSKFKFGGGCGW